MIPGGFHSLHEIKEHRKSIRALPNGTILQWIEGYTGSTASSNISPNSYTKIMDLHNGIGSTDGTVASKSYSMILCSKNGKEYKKKWSWQVGGIASLIDTGKVCIV